MYKLAVPLHLDQIEEYGLKPSIKLLNKMGVETVFIGIGCCTGPQVFVIHLPAHNMRCKSTQCGKEKGK